MADAAAAVRAIQDAQTADLIRKVVVNAGYDPRDFMVYAFGGAGPAHCATNTADLGVQERRRPARARRQRRSLPTGSRPPTSA